MTFITFIYRIEGHPKTYFGKYCCKSLPERHDGLDKFVLWYLVDAINMYKRRRYLDYAPEEVRQQDVFVGIVSISHDTKAESSTDEIRCFDFYCIHFDTSIDDTEKYINGRLVHD